ncbi:hypothetical protein [Actinoplanes teichomyceticus]|uniref:Uncharacterized protein n=1 Tax=Actinoplanes teichomyceticus TaxID=1867 RepID=A0A561WAS6_ACTTI|nr:hypothetical protein [Actinoplanes teichomyceticus]TWG20962.1 hypothetical protein FHX34_103491 [Actinoplanes teichomyceticus]GIF14781.1 hypothetical protein Ate01nite_48130 [Actinoplanes teichomyceticus]
MTTREPQWTDEDRDWMLGLALYRSWLCPLCGGLLEECTSHEDDGPEYQVRRRRCRVTDERLAAEEAATNVDRPRAVLTSVIKKE